MKILFFLTITLVLGSALNRLNAADVAEGRPKIAFRLVDAADGSPIADAQVRIAASWQPFGPEKQRRSLSLPADLLAAPPTVQPATSPPPVGVPVVEEFVVIANAAGRFETALPIGDAMLVVIHPRGIAFYREGEWNRTAGDLRIQLQPWASATGIVTQDGRPAAGVVLSISRSFANASIGSMFSFYTPPLTHTIYARTDNEGRFAFERLLPTAIDDHRAVPYSINECIVPGAPATESELKNATGGWIGMGIGRASINIERGKLRFAPGETKQTGFVMTPLCEREVSGRLVWADGKPLTAADITGTGPNPVVTPLMFWPKLSGGYSGSSPAAKVDSEGRFKLSLPLAGRWKMTASNLRPAGQQSDIEFVLPSAKNGSDKGEPIDLGDIVLQREGATSASAPKADDQGLAEVVFTLLDEQRRPLEGVTAKVTILESKDDHSSHNFYPKVMPQSRSGDGGMVRLKVPVTHRDKDGKDWPVTHVSVGLKKDGFAPLEKKFALGEKGAVLAMQRSLNAVLRVMKDGKAMPLNQLYLESGWVSHADSFEHVKWQQDERLVLRRPNAPSGIWQTQAAHIDQDKWRWFSQVAEVNLPKDKAPTVLVLQRGVQVDGVLHVDVPRPVKRGMVRVVVRMPLPANADARPLYWSDWQPVDEAGKFIFRGLPPGEAWIAAACDGWISQQGAQPEGMLQNANPNWGEALFMLWRAQPLRINAAASSTTISMVQTGTCVFHFKDRDGKPVQGARPSWDPNLDLGPQRESLSGTSRSLEDLLTNLTATSYHTESFLPKLVDRTDATGVVRLENLPPTRMRLAVKLESKLLVQVGAAKRDGVHPHDRFAPFQAEVKSGEIIEHEFRVEPKDGW